MYSSLSIGNPESASAIESMYWSFSVGFIENIHFERIGQIIFLMAQVYDNTYGSTFGISNLETFKFYFDGLIGLAGIFV